MNLNEIRQRIFDQMDFNPNLQQYRDSVVRRINDHYLHICDSAHWLFLQKESVLDLYAKVTGSDTKTVRFESSNHRKVTSTLGVTFHTGMEGQRLIQKSSGVEYEIVRVISQTELYIDKEWGGTKGSPVQDFEILFDRQALPNDCIEVLGYVDRGDDRGRLVQIERKREEYLYLDREDTGDPFAIVEDEAFEGEVPLNNPVVAADGTSGTLPVRTEFSYKYTILCNGREGPSSEEFSLTTGTGTSLAVTNIDNTGWYASTAGSRTDSGIPKHLYRRDVTNDGPWILVAVLESTIVSFTDSKLYPDQIGNYGGAIHRYTSPKDYIHFDEPGFRQYVRFWYSPDRDKGVHIRYHRRPRLIVNDNDSPALPKQYHNILVYATLEDMFLQMQATDQAQIFRARKLQLLNQMRKRYLQRDDTRKRFERFDRRRTRIVGTATTTFEGANP